ncbi:hypothetical protein B4064_3332 [Caldibacillus thermoamylovorans]|nr:hypothetical protein B4064_3332 [Caldibacillus thermoamylovorans]
MPLGIITVFAGSTYLSLSVPLSRMDSQAFAADLHQPLALLKQMNLLRIPVIEFTV